MDVKTARTRTVEGHVLPAPGTWKIDPSHSEIQFFVRHMMIAKVRGRFREFDGDHFYLKDHAAGLLDEIRADLDLRPSAPTNRQLPTQGVSR